MTTKLTIAAIILLSFLIQKCGDDPVNASQDFVSGTITYIDTLLNYDSGYYAVSIYGDNTNPFSHPPVRTDSITPVIQNGTPTSYYKVTGLASASYYIGGIWINRSNGNVTLLGVYGCDENINCTNPTKVTIPNYSGTGQLNFRSKTH
ncbi:MAG TPA: hypothetical protein VGK25_02960 [Ignavibacteria bacterium]|jgi:hypothetical protein